MIINFSNIYSQPQFEWVRNYPVQGKSLALDTAGNLILVGIKDSYIFIVKYNPSGQIIWYRDTIINPTPYGIFDAVDKFGNIYVTLQANSARLYLLKYDSSGNQKWNNNDFSEYNQCYGIALDTIGNIFVTCDSSPNARDEYLTIKFNSQGQVVWYRRYGGNYGSRIPHAITVDNSGNVYITGESNIDSIKHYDFASIKYNSSGTQQWISFYNGRLSGNDFALAICADNYGYCYVTGSSNYSVNRTTGCTIKYNYTGDSVWTKLFPTDTAGELFTRWVNFIFTDSPGNIYLAGNKSVAGSIYGRAITAMKYDKNGNMKWYKIDSAATFSQSATLDNKSNFYIIGDGRYYMKGVGYDSLGNKIWDFINPNHLYGATKILCNINGDLFVLSSSLDTAMLFKFSKPTVVRNINSSILIKDYKLVQNYPNPFNQSSIIKFQCPVRSDVILKIYDITGREVQTLVNEKLKSGIYEVKFEGRNLSSGIYFYSLFINGIKLDTKKLIILK
jgi:hypothetical protein